MSSKREVSKKMSYIHVFHHVGLSLLTDWSQVLSWLRRGHDDISFERLGKWNKNSDPLWWCQGVPSSSLQGTSDWAYARICNQISSGGQGTSRGAPRDSEASQGLCVHRYLHHRWQAIRHLGWGADHRQKLAAGGDQRHDMLSWSWDS